LLGQSYRYDQGPEVIQFFVKMYNCTCHNSCISEIFAYLSIRSTMSDYGMKQNQQSIALYHSAATANIFKAEIVNAERFWP